MKRLFRLLPFFCILLVGIGFSSCGKKSCEAGVEGYFIYLSNPYKVNNTWIRAYFVPCQQNLDIDSLSLALTNSEDGYIQSLVYLIRGQIPSKFTETQNIPVLVICDLECFHQYSMYNGYNTRPTKIVCIKQM